MCLRYSSGVVAPRQLRQIAAEALERLVSGLGVGRRHALTAAHSLQSSHQLVARDLEFLEQSADRSAVLGHREQQMLDRDVLVLEAPGFVLGPGEQAVEAA